MNYDPDGRLAFLVIPGICAAGGCEAIGAAVGCLFTPACRDLFKPFSWYLNHVVVGAKESNVPSQYLDVIQSTECIEDPDLIRDAKQRAMYKIQLAVFAPLDI